MKYRFKKNILAALLTGALVFSASASAQTEIGLYNSKYINSSLLPLKKIDALVKENFNINLYRDIKVQIITDSSHHPDHILVYLFSKKFHRVDVARINIDSQFKVKSVINNYHLTREDFRQQPGISAAEAQCPDPAIQVIAFAPNQIELEQEVTKDVADAAEAHHLNTLRLLVFAATHDNYLNAMACPNLEGNFYDGDANPDLITTVDGVIESSEIDTLLAGEFKFKAINIWLACEAYNDPMKTTMLVTAQSQKYAAGINDLLVGPSDRAAACAFKAAMDGQPMTAAFETCYTQVDVPSDQWGFGGDGADYFAT